VTNYNKQVDLTPASAAPPSRLQAAAAECATWQHGVDEANQAIAQMGGTGGHAAALMAPFPGLSMPDSVPPMRPSSPGQAAVMDALTAMHEGNQPGQGQ
jgi:hypothetical protein